MHASKQLHEAQFEIEIATQRVLLTDVLPGWTAYDRVGVVVHEPYGALGASLLIEAAVARFYAHDSRRADELAQYPPVFLFHVGGRYGDHSSMDFWPSRREVFLPPDPYEVLGAIRDRGITRLMVPDVESTGLDYAYAAPSGWTDVHAATEQTLSSFVYSASGHVPGGDVRLRSCADHTDSLASDVLDVQELIERFETASEQDLLDMELGPSTPEDFDGWLTSFRSRIGEVPEDVRKRIRTGRSRATAEGTLTQTYRRTSTADALGRFIPR